MANAHRRYLDVAQLDHVLQSCGVDAPLVDHQLLEGGTFNTVYRLRCADRPALVLKVSPDPNGARLTYEQGLVRTEALFYDLAGTRAALPTPAVIGVHHFADELGGGDALLVTGPAFGYPSMSTGPLTPRWYDAFAAMVAAVLRDAERYRVTLPVPAAGVLDALKACATDLADVTVASLVHFDLWDGNVLLVLEGVASISGIVDGERALWGDPVMDFVSAVLFAEIRDDADFIRGYELCGNTLPLDASARRRLLLYRLYLGLIMTVEPVPRGEGHHATPISRAP